MSEDGACKNCKRSAGEHFLVEASRVDDQDKQERFMCPTAFFESEPGQLETRQAVVFHRYAGTSSVREGSLSGGPPYPGRMITSHVTSCGLKAPVSEEAPRHWIRSHENYDCPDCLLAMGCCPGCGGLSSEGHGLEIACECGERYVKPDFGVPGQRIVGEGV